MEAEKVESRRWAEFFHTAVSASAVEERYNCVRGSAAIRICFTGFYSRHGQGRIELLPPMSIRSDIQHNSQCKRIYNAHDNRGVQLNSGKTWLKMGVMSNSPRRWTRMASVQCTVYTHLHFWFDLKLGAVRMCIVAQVWFTVESRLVPGWVATIQQIHNAGA